MKFLNWIKWRIRGKPHITYSGFHCGCCGNWVEEQFNIPDYKSVGKWWDGWGICERCAGDEK